MPIHDVPEGDPDRHLSLEELEKGLRELPPAPKDEGRVAALFARPGTDRREPLEKARLTAEKGMPGDRWSDRDVPKIPAQLAVMQIDVAELIANGQSISMFGDNLFLDLDLSLANLAVGTRVQVGGATLEVTPEPHDGCIKFKSRFGGDALRLVARKETREHNYRGIYFKVIEDGDVAVGDPVRVLR